jgi:hypothetical protein
LSRTVPPQLRFMPPTPGDAMGNLALALGDCGHHEARTPSQQHRNVATSIARLQQKAPNTLLNRHPRPIRSPTREHRHMPAPSFDPAPDAIRGTLAASPLRLLWTRSSTTQSPLPPAGQPWMARLAAGGSGTPPTSSIWSRSTLTAGTGFPRHHLIKTDNPRLCRDRGANVGIDIMFARSSVLGRKRPQWPRYGSKSMIFSGSARPCRSPQEAMLLT